MKLPLLSLHEPTVKQSYSFKQSTMDVLLKYQAYYKATYGQEVATKDLVEHILLGFIADDKGFKRWCDQQAKPAEGAPAVVSGNSSVTSTPVEAAATAS